MAPTFIDVDPSDNYLPCLLSDRRLYFKITEGVYALPAYKEATGQIISYKYRIVEHKGEELYDCYCKEYGCLHVDAVKRLYPRFAFQNGETQLFKEEIKVCELYLNQEENRQLFGVYSERAKSFGVIKHTKCKIICCSCIHKPESCDHRTMFIEERPEINEAIHQPREFIVKSKERIPYPLIDDIDVINYNAYCLGNSYPNHLKPIYNPGRMCACEQKNTFNEADPELSGWIIYNDAHIHTGRTTSIAVIIYYRPTVGNCKCIQEYDGRSHFLLNLNNKHLFTHEWLINILHSTQTTRYPLYSAFVANNYNRTYRGNLQMLRHQYEDLRIAYNAFIRLLDFNEQGLFACEQCGDYIDILTIDATALGFNTTFMPPDTAGPPPDFQIPEYVGGDRVFVKDNVRPLLARYVGLIKGIYVKNYSAMSITDFNKLIRLLRIRNKELADVIASLGNMCPEPLRKLIGELSRKSATSGLFQLGGVEARGARQVIEEVANGIFTNIETNLDVLEKYCPLVINFLNSSNLVPAEYISLLMKKLLSSVDGNFRMPVPQADKYGPPESALDSLEKFPNHHVIRGRGNYPAKSNQKKDSDCNKETRKKRTLSSGIFTFFCKHSICIGFQLMRTPESPRIPFDILMRRFDKMPRIIIYDNACQLHTYVLKREPARFKGTMFLVDRLHFSNHVACSLGYCMETYSSNEEIKELNSQVCEQANSDLRHLATQIAHMTPDNALCHVTVFLCIRNMYKTANDRIDRNDT